MIEFEYTIKDAVGLHARPVALIVKAASSFQESKITITFKDRSVDARRMLAIMALQVKHGDTILVSVEGGEETIVFDAIRNVFMDNNI